MIILILVLHKTNRLKEGFTFPDSNHTSYVSDSQEKFNKATNLLNLTQPSIPLTPDNKKKVELALNDGGVDLTIPDREILNFKTAAMCESKPLSCDAFDDTDFASNCGMSFDKSGTSYTGKPHIGGKFVSSQDRSAQIDEAQKVLDSHTPPYDPYKVYKPTLGQSKQGTFSLTKDQCVVIKEKIECAEKQSFQSPNCTQCYTSQGFSRVDPSTGKLPSTLKLYGVGNAIITSNTTISGDGVLSKTNGLSVVIPEGAEGSTFIVEISPVNSSAYVCGFLQGESSRGLFKFDFMKLVQKELLSDAKPRINGISNVDGFSSFNILPSTGKTSIRLQCTIPFTFLNTYDNDAMSCDNGPIITQESSATFLESDPCFSKKNKPGNYTMECLQSRWVALGGTQQGSGYPNTQEKANAIQMNGGSTLDINTIVNNLAPKLKQAITGQNTDGSYMSINQWNELSVWGTGVSINTPCDGPLSDIGPLSRDCLEYLYKNLGSGSHIGPTYTLQSDMSSSLGQKGDVNTYCQPGAPLDPATDSGYELVKSLGGINSVKQKYDEINRVANDNTLSNSGRKEAIKMCYNIDV